MGFACARCGVEHDLSELEPSFQRPDAVFEVPTARWRKRVQATKNFCAIWGERDVADRWFVRVLLPFTVSGRPRPCSWGVWVEVSRETFDDVQRLWDAPDQQAHGPWPASLANDAPGYAHTRGLAGALYFADPEQIPHLRFEPGQEQHGFVADWTNGVSAERLQEWQMGLLHPGA